MIAAERLIVLIDRRIIAPERAGGYRLFTALNLLDLYELPQSVCDDVTLQQM